MGAIHTHRIATRNQDAQKFFDQGLALVYAFNFGEAIDSFQHATELDPNTPMPYWGIALAEGPNYNSPTINRDHERAGSTPSRLPLVSRPALPRRSADATRTDATHTDATRTDAPHTDAVPEQSAEEASREMPGWVRYFPGGMPPAEIRVIVPFATLIGDDDNDSDCEGDGVAEEPGTLSDGTALPAHVARELAFAAGSTWRRLVTDPITGEAIELSTTRYEPPPRLREAIQVRDGTCRAPGSMVPADRCDLDHDLPWAHGGATCAANLSAKSRRAHGHKTRGQWTTQQLADGTILWTTGTGRQYVTYPKQYDTSVPGRLLDLEQGPPIDHRPARAPRAPERPDPERADPGPPPF